MTREHNEMKRRQWVHGLPAKHRQYVLLLESECDRLRDQEATTRKEVEAETVERVAAWLEATGHMAGAFPKAGEAAGSVKSQHKRAALARDLRSGAWKDTPK